MIAGTRRKASWEPPTLVITKNLGKNPEKGGNPPRDNILIESCVKLLDFFLKMLDSLLKLFLKK